MIKQFRKLLCRLFGHRSICLHSHIYDQYFEGRQSSYSGWECERCGKTFTKGWDE